MFLEVTRGKLVGEAFLPPIMNRAKMVSISVFLDITKVIDFWWQNSDFSRTQEVCHVIHIFFESTLGKV